MTEASLDAPRQRLFDALCALSPADDEERRHVESVLALVGAEARCFSRHVFTPGHLTGSAFIVDERGRLLLHHHRRLDRWLQMGGHDEGEYDPLRTALREATEESGLASLELAWEGILDVDVHAIPEGKKEPGHLHHDVRFLFRTRTPEAIVHDDSESKALDFFALEEAERLLGDASAGRVVRKIRRILENAGP